MLLAIRNRKPNSGLRNTFSHQTSLVGCCHHLVLVWQLNSDVKDRSFFSLSALPSLLNVLAFCPHASCFVSSRSMMWSPLAAREAGEGIIQLFQPLQQRWVRGLRKGWWVIQLPVGHRSVVGEKINHKYISTCHHKTSDGPGSFLCMVCEWNPRQEGTLA